MVQDNTQHLLHSSPTSYAATDQLDEVEENNTIKVSITPTPWCPWLWRSKTYTGSIITLVVLIAILTGIEIVILHFNLPAVSPEDRPALKFPHNLEELRALRAILATYMDQHFLNVYVAYVYTYIYLQSLSIPGSMWLSVLGGALFNFWLTLLTCSAAGASVAYLISGSLGSVAVIRLFGDRIAEWNIQLQEHKQHMFNYIIALRIVPFPPNWTVNIGAPHLGVPLGVFFLGTFIGVAPPSFIHVQAGAALDRLTSTDDLKLFTPLNILCLAGVVVAALLPVYIKRQNAL